MKQQQFNTMKSLLVVPKDAEELQNTIDLDPDELFALHSIESKKQLKRWLMSYCCNCDQEEINALASMNLVRKFNDICKMQILSGVTSYEQDDIIVKQIIKNVSMLELSHTALYSDRIEFLSNGELIGITMPLILTKTILRHMLFHSYYFREEDAEAMFDIIIDKIAVKADCLK